MEHRGNSIPEDLNPDGYQSLIDFLDAQLSRYADRPAFTSLGCTLTYRQLDTLSRAFTRYIQTETDLQPGDRLAIQMPNLVQYPVVLYGALRAGLVVVNTNPLYTPDEMRHQFIDSGARMLVIHASMAFKAEQILSETRIERVLVTQIGDLCAFPRRILLNAAIRYLKRMEPPFDIPAAVPLRSALMPHRDRPVRIHQAAPGDIAALQYTGGTTGVAKGAVLTHANLLSNVLQGCKRMRDVSGNWSDLVISPLPLYHIYAFLVAQIIFARGGHSVLIPNPRDLFGFIRELKRWKITTFIGLNTLFAGLLRRPEFARLDFSRLILTLSGGMALTQRTAEEWHQVTGCQIVEAYGLTEASPAVSTDDPVAPHLSTIGIPLDHTECMILDKQGLPVAPGVEGELAVRGPQVMREYWNQPQETAAVFTADGYLRTGDIAVADASGDLHIVDRAKDLIIVSGFNVYPTELENKLLEHPEILECAAVGLPDEVRGEVVRLFVVAANETLTAEQIKAWCRDTLAAYKCPKEVVFMAELPKTPVGKVLRRALR